MNTKRTRDEREQSNGFQPEYILIPGAVLNDPDLLPAAKLIYSRLKLYAGKKGKAYHPNQEALAEEACLEERQLRRVLSQLRDQGWIGWDKARTCVYTMNDDARLNGRWQPKYILIPYAVYTDRNLTPVAKLVYGLLRFHAWKKGKAYPQHETLAREVGLTRRQLQRVLIQLRDEGWISWRRGRRNCTYTVHANHETTGHRVPLRPDMDVASEASCHSETTGHGCRIRPDMDVASEASYPYMKCRGEVKEHTTPASAGVARARSFTLSELVQVLCSSHPKKRRRDPVRKALASVLEQYSDSDPNALMEQIARVHGLWCKTENWTEEGGRYVPGLAKWIVDEGWTWQPEVAGYKFGPVYGYCDECGAPKVIPSPHLCRPKSAPQAEPKIEPAVETPPAKPWVEPKLEPSMEPLPPLPWIVNGVLMNLPRGPERDAENEEWRRTGRLPARYGVCPEPREVNNPDYVPKIPPGMALPEPLKETATTG
jgi:transcription initiation factor IIE alpha subunit